MSGSAEELTANPVGAGILWRVFAPFAAGYFLSYLYRSVNAVIAPDLVQSLGIAAGDLGLLTSVYFLAFAVAQIPLGLLLDRYGPRRVEAILLVIAAAGAALFAVSTGLPGVLLGRALIGLGVSACLMAAIKAFVIWFPPVYLPALNGWALAAGGLGAVASTAPVAALLTVTDWCGLFGLLAAATLVMAGAILGFVPEQPGRRVPESLRAQWQGVATIFRNRHFWRVAPASMLSQGCFMAIQGLWAGPWLRDVAGLERDAAAGWLFLTAVAMMAGYPLMGTLAYRLSRAGLLRPLQVAATGMLLFSLTQLTIVLGSGRTPLPVWLAFGFFGTSGALMYAVLSQEFPAALAGRVNTALNLLVFVAAFVAQWGIGAVVDRWPAVDGHYDPQAYRVAFGVALALQVLMWGRMVWSGNRRG